MNRFLDNDLARSSNLHQANSSIPWSPRQEVPSQPSTITGPRPQPPRRYSNNLIPPTSQSAQKQDSNKGSPASTSSQLKESGFLDVQGGGGVGLVGDSRNSHKVNVGENQLALGNQEPAKSFINKLLTQAQSQPQTTQTNSNPNPPPPPSPTTKKSILLTKIVHPHPYVTYFPGTVQPDVPETLMDLVRRFEKLERWSVGRIKGLEKVWEDEKVVGGVEGKGKGKEVESENEKNGVERERVEELEEEVRELRVKVTLLEERLAKSEKNKNINGFSNNNMMGNFGSTSPAPLSPNPEKKSLRSLSLDVDRDEEDDGFEETKSRSREVSISPNGRKRYTTTLGDRSRSVSPSPQPSPTRASPIPFNLGEKDGEKTIRASNRSGSGGGNGNTNMNRDESNGLGVEKEWIMGSGGWKGGRLTPPLTSSGLVGIGSNNEGGKVEVGSRFSHTSSKSLSVPYGSSNYTTSTSTSPSSSSSGFLGKQQQQKPSYSNSSSYNNVETSTSTSTSTGGLRARAQTYLTSPRFEDSGSVGTVKSGVMGGNGFSKSSVNLGGGGGGGVGGGGLGGGMGSKPVGGRKVGELAKMFDK